MLYFPNFLLFVGAGGLEKAAWLFLIGNSSCSCVEIEISLGKFGYLLLLFFFLLFIIEIIFISLFIKPACTLIDKPQLFFLCLINLFHIASCLLWLILLTDI